MNAKKWCVCNLVALFALAALFAASEGRTEAADEDKAEAFEGKSFDLKAKDKGKVALSFPAGKSFSVMVRSEKETDVHLYVYASDKKVVAKDDSPGPSCDLTFTPEKAGKYVIEVVNEGPGANRCTLKVKPAKKK